MLYSFYLRNVSSTSSTFSEKGKKEKKSKISKRWEEQNKPIMRQILDKGKFIVKFSNSG
jgi:hypothetical protein